MDRFISLRLGSPTDIKTSMIPGHTVLSGVTVPATPVTELLIFPTTQQEYTAVMEEIKKLYEKRQYKQCSARCIQILDNIKDPYRVHPLYSIYISFYAAVSLELTARSLHINSSNKLTTLQQSLYYYQHAESFVDYASFSADPSLIKAARQRSSSVSSSIRSSTDSIFSSSSSSATSSPLPSPTSSIYGVSDLVSSLTHTRSLSKTEGRPTPRKVPKRVSFSEIVYFDDDEDIEGKLSFRDSLLLESFPSPPTPPIASPPSTFSSPISPQELNTTQEKDTIRDHLLSRSLARYLSQLSAMHRQIHTHIASTNAQIRAITISKKARRSNLPNLFDASTLSCPGDVAAHEAKQVQLKARIERLKNEGWKRERFNPEPYRRLCEDVEAEMN